jgi:hypothetical protein
MSDQATSNDDLAGALRTLANRWTLKARDHARESKEKSAQGDSQSAYYHRGTAETYHKLALELAALVKGEGTTGEAMPTTVRATSTQETAAPEAEPTVQYARVEANEVIRLLSYVDINPRDLTVHKDYAFTAVFSRWQPVAEMERVEKIRSADPRIIILDKGKLRDTGDPFVDFAFKL